MSGGYVTGDVKHFSQPAATPLGAKFQHGAFSQQQATNPLDPKIEKQDKNNMQLPFEMGKKKTD